MNQRADVIIIGGGVTGLSTALHLKLCGIESVVVLERHHVGAGQSGRAAGFLRALSGHTRAAAWLYESQRFFFGCTERFGEELEVSRVGYLIVTESERRERLAEAVSAAKQAGCVAQEIDADQAHEIQPGLRHESDDVYAFEPNAGFVDAMPATQAMGRVAKGLGARIIEGCDVREIITRGDTVAGVESSAGRFESPVVLIGTSVWGGQQLAQLGTDVPVYPHRAEMAFFQVPPGGGHRVRCTLSDTRTELYLRPEGEKQMFVGWREGDRIRGVGDMVAENPDDYKQTAHFETIREMHAQLARTLPFMAEGFVHRSYVCVYDYTPDAMPILDRAESVRGLYFALGFSGGGLSLSPWVGRMMAQYISQGTKPSEIEPLSLSRFSEGRLVEYRLM